MQLNSPHALLPLARHSTQRLTHAKGLLLRARRGTVWITVDHDPRDIVLRPGQAWVVDATQPVLISALGDSALVEVCDAQLRRARENRRFWQDTLDSLWQRGAPASAFAAAVPS